MDAATNHYGPFAGEEADVTDAVETDVVETIAVDITDVAARWIAG
jgi:hypothetical protein